MPLSFTKNIAVLCLLFFGACVEKGDEKNQLKVLGPWVPPAESYWIIQAETLKRMTIPCFQRTVTTAAREETAVLHNADGWLRLEKMRPMNTDRPATGPVDADGSFKLEYTQGVVHHGQFADDGQSFRMWSEDFYSCTVTHAKRYEGPAYCRIWDHDDIKLLEKAVTELKDSDARLKSYNAFWNANTSRFAAPISTGRGEYTWDGAMWVKVAQSTDYVFKFEDGSILSPSRLDHADGWIFSYGDGLYYTTFNLDGRYVIDVVEGFLNPPLSARTPISYRSEETELVFTDTFDISVDGFNFHAFLANNKSTIRLNEEVLELTEGERFHYCPFIKTEIEAFFPHAQKFVDMTGPRAVQKALFGN